MFGSQILVAVFQGLQFILIARALGAHDFGRMAGILAITAVLLPFSGIGAENVIVIRLARGLGKAPVYYGNGLLMALLSGLVLIALYCFIGTTYLATLSTLKLLIIFGFSEIIVTKLIDISAHVFFGFEQHVFSGLFFSLHSLFRMLFASAFFALLYRQGELKQWLQITCDLAFPDDNLVLWAWFHLCAGLLAFSIVFSVTVKQVGWPKFDMPLAIKEVRTGIFYSIGISAKSVYTNIDKWVLARMVSPEINGAYTAAFRLIYMAFTPIEAVLLAASAKFFQEGAKGVTASFMIATRIVLFGSLYCLLFALAVFLCSPLIPLVLGDSYQLSTEILRWLAFLPVVLLLQDAYSDALTGADRQMARSFFQVTVAVCCFALNMVLVPQYSWLGSVASTYISQAILACLIIGLSVFLVRREAKNQPAYKS